MIFSQVTSLEIHKDLFVHSVIRGEFRTTVNFCDKYGKIMVTNLVENDVNNVIIGLAGQLTKPEDKLTEG